MPKEKLKIPKGSSSKKKKKKGKRIPGVGNPDGSVYVPEKD